MREKTDRKMRIFLQKLPYICIRSMRGLSGRAETRRLLYARLCGKAGYFLLRAVTDFPCDALFIKEKATVLDRGWLMWKRAQRSNRK